MRGLPPVSMNLNEWAQALNRALQFGWSLLEYKNDDSRATQDGLLMWDPSLDLMVVSRDGAWVPVLDRGAVGYGKLASAYTLTSTTAAQKIFNWSTNGALTLTAGEYIFRSQIRLDTMSATSGNAKLSLGGTATMTRTLFYAWGTDAASSLAVTTVSGSGASSATGGAADVVTPTTAGQMMVTWQGSLVVTGAGTLIPQIALTTAAAAIVRDGSWFSVERMADAATLVGSWS